MVDLTNTNKHPKEFSNISKVRPTDYILRDYPPTNVEGISRKYLDSRGWIFIGPMAPTSTYMVAEIERICRYGREMVKKNDLIDCKED